MHVIIGVDKFFFLRTNTVGGGIVCMCITLVLIFYRWLASFSFYQAQKAPNTPRIDVIGFDQRELRFLVWGRGPFSISEFESELDSKN